MPKTTKSTANKTKSTKTAARTTRTRKKTEENVKCSPEYEEYLERYAEFGRDRPRLSPQEFDKLDDELLDLLDLSGSALNDDQVIRIQELEYLLIDTE